MTPQFETSRVGLLLAIAWCAVWLAPAPAAAWGMTGHAVVAEVAERRLPEPLRRRVRDLLGGASLASVSAWADTTGALKPATRRWHYVNIPFDAEGFDSGRHCIPDPGEGCIVSSLEKFTAALADARKPIAERREALRYVVHLVADLHQPLHCIDRGDAGGTQRQVVFFEQPTNLHMVWDVGILERASYDWGEHVSAVEAVIEREGSSTLPRKTPAEWASECHALARTVYPEDGVTQLDAEYQSSKLPFVHRQLATAAVRLGRLLRSALAAR